MAGLDKVDPAVLCLDGRMVPQPYREMPARVLDQATPVARNALHRRAGVTGKVRVPKS